MTGDNAPLDLVTIRATVRRAVQERTALPRAEEVHEITRALRTHLWLMLPAAQAIADGLVRGTGPWHRWRALIDRVRVDLDHDGGAGAVLGGRAHEGPRAYVPLPGRLPGRVGPRPGRVDQREHAGPPAGHWNMITRRIISKG
ncbi:DUF6415 family natural product biosynthesis protein [Streptomyces netropsis]